MWRVECKDAEQKDGVDEDWRDDSKSDDCRKQCFRHRFERVKDLLCFENGIECCFTDATTTGEDIEDENGAFSNFRSG
jgi:hypothetical protein